MLRSRSRGRAFSSRQHRTGMHCSACLLSRGARARVACSCCCCLASCGAYCRPTTFCFTVQNKGCHSGFLRGKSLGKAKWREKSNHLGYCVIKGPCNRLKKRDLDIEQQRTCRVCERKVKIELSFRKLISKTEKVFSLIDCAVKDA